MSLSERSINCNPIFLSFYYLLNLIHSVAEEEEVEVEEVEAVEEVEEVDGKSER